VCLPSPQPRPLLRFSQVIFLDLMPPPIIVHHTPINAASMPMLLKYLLSHLMESLIQVMDSELQFQMVGIHALQQLAAPGFEHLKMKVT